MFLLGWIGDYPAPDNFLRVAKPWKGIKWHHKTYQQLLEKASSITDQNTRLKLYQQSNKILIKEAIIVPLYYGQIHYLVKPWIKSSATSALSHLYFKDIIINT